MEKIRLNLGCGLVYKPGYINIDKFDKTVADEVCDMGNLSFKSNSVDLIEASHVIEHLDYVHCIYALSEWFRVLKPGGTLVLETPDLEKSFSKLISANQETRETTLQWIYGIDSPGMQHKTGFTFSLLKNLLGGTGFEKITEKEQETHRYEPGMRIVCEKSSNPGKQLLACFRGRLKNGLGVDDSYILIPLENHLRKISGSCGELNELISKTAVCNPLIPLAFIEECINQDVVDESTVCDKIRFLNYLDEVKFPEKVFSLWIKSRKTAGLEKEFKGFISRLEFLMLDICNRTGYRERLRYVTDLNPTDIEVFDLYLVSLKAKKLFNKGVKCFHGKEFTKALDFLLKSLRINPDNPLAYWNIARLACILKLEKHKVVDNYEKTLGLMKNRGDKGEVERELEYVINNRIGLIKRNPVSED